MDNEASDSFPHLKQPAPPAYPDDAADYFAPQDAHPFGGDGFWTPRGQHSNPVVPNGSAQEPSAPAARSHDEAAAGPKANGARPAATRHDTPTQPIDVPGGHAAPYHTESALADSTPPPAAGDDDDDDAFVRDFLARRRPSISFDPQVRLDRAAGPPPAAAPRPATRKNSKKRSVFDEIAKKTAGPDAARAEADLHADDARTGRPLSDDPNTDTPAVAPAANGAPRDGRYVAHQPRWPLLQATVDDLAAGSAEPHLPHQTDADARPAVALRTSFADAPPSPISLGSPLPPDAGGASPGLSPRTASPRARRAAAGRVSPQRTFSAAAPSALAAAQSSSAGVVRGLSRRATSASVSPSSAASHHLSKYAPAPAPATPPASPDAEGQEVRAYVLGRQIGFGGFSVIREALALAPEPRGANGSAGECGANGHAPSPGANGHIPKPETNGHAPSPETDGHPPRPGAKPAEALAAASPPVLRRAVKIVRRRVPGAGDAAAHARLQRAWEREVALWRRLRHPHVLPLYEVAETPFATFAFTHLNTGGTLFDAVRAHRGAPSGLSNGVNEGGGNGGGVNGGGGGGGLPANLVRRYARQLARALAYLHTRAGVVHRDLKLENCLLDMGAADAGAVGGRLLLCDFGLAGSIPSASSSTTSSNTTSNAASTATSDDESGDDTAGADGDPDAPALGPSRLSTSFDGSLPYAAPELLEAVAAPGDDARGPLRRRGPAVDLWAFGCVVFALATGRLPFEDAFVPRLRLLILGGEWDREVLRRREHGTATVAPANGGGEGAASPAELQPRAKGLADRPRPLAGLAELVEGCLARESRARWDVRRCLAERWLVGDDGAEFRNVVGEDEVLAGDELNGWAPSSDD